MEIDQRTLDLQQIANDIERMANRHLSEPISITFERMTPMGMEHYTEWQQRKFLLLNDEEYFFISQGPALLYAVNVTADNILTAAHELMDKIAKKF